MITEAEQKRLLTTENKEWLREQAVRVFRVNRQEGYSRWKGKEYSFISPAAKEYTFQWLWDTAFHAIILSDIDAEWAQRELLSHMEGQRDDGFIPHVIFWNEPRVLPHWAYIESNPWTRRITNTAITQPPALALAAERCYAVRPDQEFLQVVTDKLSRFHQWLLDKRDPDGDGLVAIISPNESGMDELPVFQEVMGYKSEDPLRLHYYYRKADLLNQRYIFDDQKILAKDYFNVEELLFNCVMVEANRSLARLLEVRGMKAEAEYWLGVARKTEQSILEKCWDEQEGIFYSVYSKEEKQIKVKTIASLMPLFLDGLPKDKSERLVKEHLLNPAEFWTDYPVPSVAKSESYYAPEDTPLYKVKLLWRGPTWMNTNWFVVKGLRKHGYDEVADEIAVKSLKMIQEYGLREYYNPETGEGYRRKDFGWSGLAVDMW